MSLDVVRNAGVVYQAGSYKALAMFAAALKSVTRRSMAVAQLWETVSRAVAVGEVQLDTIRLEGLQVTDEDVEVRQQRQMQRGKKKHLWHRDGAASRSSKIDLGKNIVDRVVSL